MKNNFTILLITLFMGVCLNAQVKIGDNPQNIDPSSVLELESTDKVLVITRVTTTQMNAIVPSQGALCYNTELQAVHFYDGTQWVNIGSGGGTGGPLTADPIVNITSTIVITPTATGNNLEVAQNSITSAQITDGGINGVDIQDGSIGPGKIQNNSVTEEKLSENSVGTFALDNANIGVTAFANDAGYLTAGDLSGTVSGDANNAISAGSDAGAFYDDTNLMNDVLDNATAIAADGDQSSSNELQNLVYNATSNILTLSTPATANNQVDLSGLVGGTADGSETIIDATNSTVTVTGTGTTLDPYILAGGGGTADGSETIIDATNSTVTVTGTGTALDPYVLTGSGGTADGSETVIDATNSTVTVTGTGTALDPYVLTGSSGTADGSETVIDATNSTVTVTGTGTALDPYVLTGSGGTADGSETVIDATNSTVTVTGTGTALDPYVLTGSGGTADGSETIIDAVNSNVTVTGTGTALDPYVLVAASGGNEQSITLDAATNQIDLLNDDATINSSIKLDGVTINTFNDGNNDLIQLADDAVTLAKIEQNNATNGQVLQWSDDGEAPGIGGWITGDQAPHLGAKKSIFYADEITGLPTTADDNLNTRDNNGFYWDPNGRNLAPGWDFGALFVGLGDDPAGDPHVQSNIAKVHIADNYGGSDPNWLGFALQVQNYSGSPTGILFSTATNTPTNYGKGALMYDNSVGGARGDFHFLQNDVGDDSFPLIADKAFTIKNNKDIVLYGGIDVDGTGLAPDLGTAGEVLTSTGTGVEWGAPGSGTNQDATEVDLAVPFDIDGDTTNETTVEDAIIALDATSSDDQNASEVDLVTPIDIDGDLTNETTVEEAIAKLAASSGGDNLSNTDLTQTALEDRTYNLNGQNLNFLGGTVAIGNFDNDPLTNTPAISTDRLDVNGQIRARDGFAASPGTANLPSYGFYTNNDNDTGMFRADPDQIGFSTGGLEAIRIDASQNVGVGTIIPTSTLHTGGSFAANIRSDGSVTVTPADDDYTIIITGATTVNLPTPATSNLGRIYILKNVTAADINIPGYISSNGSNDLLINGILQIQSDGISWYQIN